MARPIPSPALEFSAIATGDETLVESIHMVRRSRDEPCPAPPPTQFPSTDRYSPLGSSLSPRCAPSSPATSLVPACCAHPPRNAHRSAHCRVKVRAYLLASIPFPPLTISHAGLLATNCRLPSQRKTSSNPLFFSFLDLLLLARPWPFIRGHMFFLAINNAGEADRC